MKVKVIKEFVDRHTQKLHTVGSTFECTAERFEEIQESGNFCVKLATKTSNKEN